MDPVDAKIIELLIKNARLDNREIADKLGTSDRTIARRIKSLEDAGIIKGYTVKIGSELHEGTMPKGGAENVNTSISEWESIRNSLSNIFGSGSGMILFCIGYSIGKDLGEKIIARGLEKSGQCLAFAQTVQEKGWGRVDFENIDFREGKGKVVLLHSPFKKSADKSMCYEVKGIIAGFFESVYNKKFKVTEEKCVRKGDSCCEFTIEGNYL